MLLAIPRTYQFFNDCTRLIDKGNPEFDSMNTKQFSTGMKRKGQIVIEQIVMILPKSTTWVRPRLLDSRFRDGCL